MFKIYLIQRDFCFATIWEVQSKSSVQKHRNICYLKKEPTAVFCRCYKNHLVNYPSGFYLPLTTNTEKAMAPHSSTPAWKIPWTKGPGRLQSMGSLRVGHDWETSLSLFTFTHWRRKWQPTPVFLLECSLEGLMLKLKLQSFGHLMQRADSLEKTLMLGKIESERRRGRQRIRWLDGITDSMDVSP